MRGGDEAVLLAGGIFVGSRRATQSFVRWCGQSSCFVAGTPLLTPTGAKPIEQFRVGDAILSRAEGSADGAVVVQNVEQTFVRESPIMSLRVRGQEIRTTAEHPFYVEGKGWISAREITPGDRLSSHDGQWVTVEAVTDLNEVATVYNLRVSDYHTYFVGSREWGFSVWAHNACIVELDAIRDAAEIAANGGKRFKIVEGSRTIGYHADRVAAERWHDLAFDPAIRRLRPNEAETALRVEQNQGVTLSRYNPPPGRKGDWIDTNGLVYDGVSPAPARHFDAQFANWEAQLLDHAAKVDRPVVDLTGLGLGATQTQRVIDRINLLPAADRARVILLR